MPSLDLFKHDPSAISVAAGDTLFSQGEAGDHMYVLISGAIELTVHDKALDAVAPGDIFGEMVLVDHLTRSATAKATSDSIVVPIDKRRFLYLVQNTPHFAVEVMHAMSDRLRRMNELV